MVCIWCPDSVEVAVVMNILVYFVTEESVLRDLKALLMEAKQRVPPFLHQLDSLTDDYLALGGKL